jgi:hypothetical protein
LEKKLANLLHTLHDVDYSMAGIVAKNCRDNPRITECMLKLLNSGVPYWQASNILCRGRINFGRYIYDALKISDLTTVIQNVDNINDEWNRSCFVCKPFTICSALDVRTFEIVESKTFFGGLRQQNGYHKNILWTGLCARHIHASKKFKYLCTARDVLGMNRYLKEIQRDEFGHPVDHVHNLYWHAVVWLRAELKKAIKFSDENTDNNFASCVIAGYLATIDK